MKRQDRTGRSGRNSRPGSAAKTAGREPEKHLEDPGKLREELEHYQSSGAQIMLSGRACYPDTVVQACLREGCIYMPDYIIDEENKIRKINYIRIDSE